MKVTKLIVAMGLFAGGCDDGADEADLSSVDQDINVYQALSDASTGGTQGFFVFSPWGTTPEAGPFAGSSFNFGTTRVNVKVLNIDCNPTGPTPGSTHATLGVAVGGTAPNQRYQFTKNVTQIGTGLVTGNCYRFQPTLDGFALGFTDVQVTSAAATAPFRRVTPASNLTIKFRTESSLNTDTDTDTVPDWRDNCPTDANTDQQDTDADGVGDVCDVLDGDGDGVPDNTDNCPSVSNSDQADGDTDGVGNACDNCVAVSNSNQADGDTDGVGNACDNCAAVANADQANTDGDSVGDACDGCPTDGFKTGSGGCGCGFIDVDVDGDGAVDSCQTVGDRCGP